MTQTMPPGWPPTHPRQHTGPGPVLADDGSHERLYNPDGWGCGKPLALAAALSVLLVLAVPAVGLLWIGGGW